MKSVGAARNLKITVKRVAHHNNRSQCSQIDELGQRCQLWRVFSSCAVTTHGFTSLDFMSKLQCNIDMKYKRALSSVLKKTKSSILLLGPRQTGKSTLLKSLQPDLSINLSLEREFLAFSSQPELLEEMILEKNPKTIFIDEIQRLPSLLNTIQALIDDHPKKYKFYLSGSSARKLRRGSANLLPGRMISLEMTPLTLEELDYKFNVDQILSYGLLPGIFTEKNLKEKELILTSYGAVYLKEEIQAEALTKNIEGFSRFLFVAAAKNGEFLDYSKLGNQAGVAQKTATRFFEILEDSLIVFRLEPYTKDSFRRLVKHPKFYFFDNGVLNSLLGSYKVTSDRKGSAFETFVIGAIRNLLLSRMINFRMSTYRSSSGSEVDLILNLPMIEFAIEIKATKNIGKSDLNGLQSFSEVTDNNSVKLIIYLGDYSRKIGDVSVLPLSQGIKLMTSYL
jgi:predicted AAA+ superfamily ATPase